MVVVRLAAFVALTLASLGAAPPATAAQSDDEAPRAPIPYSQLVRGDRPVRHAPPRRTARPVPPKPAGPGAAPGVSAPGMSPTPLVAGTGRVGAGGSTVAGLAPPPPLAAPPVQAGARLPRGALPAPAELEAFVDGVVARALAQDHLAGAAVAVVGGGQVLLEKGYGLARLSPAGAVDPRRTLFRLGGASRLLTWLEVLRSAELGRLRLDRPVDDALPPELRPPAEGFARPIRLDQLLSQSSGFEAREFGRLYVTSPDRISPLDVQLRRARPHRVREAGGPPTGGDYGAALAGAAAAHAAHRPFEDLVEADLLRPAGLLSTSFREARPARDDLPAPLPDALAQRMAEGHAWTSEGVTTRPPVYGGGLAPAVSASTTADDMARLLLLVLAGGRRPDGAVVWGPAVDAALRTPGPGGAGAAATLGWVRAPLPGGFAGLEQAGGAPGHRAGLWVAPQLGLGVVVLADGDEGAPLVAGLAPALVERFYAAPAARAPSAVDGSAYAGVYLDTRRAYHGLEGFVARLRRLSRVTAGAQGGLVLAGGGRASAWTPTGPDRFTGADGAGELTFLGGGDRRAAYLAPGLRSAERVGWLHRPLVLGAAAAVAALAAVLVLAGPLLRFGREDARHTDAQLLAALVQGAAALIWLGSGAAFAVFAARTRDPTTLMLDWPAPWLVGASWAALAATALTAVQFAQLGGVWSDGRRAPGWGTGRKLRHTVTLLVFTGFATVLAAWGALEPWSS